MNIKVKEKLIVATYIETVQTNSTLILLQIIVPWPHTRHPVITNKESVPRRLTLVIEELNRSIFSNLSYLLKSASTDKNHYISFKCSGSSD